MIERRALLKGGATLAALVGLSKAYAVGRAARASVGLVPDPKGLLDLPAGFSYDLVSVAGRPMASGLFVPGKFDGMAAFAGDGGRTVLIRNHELHPDSDKGSWASGDAPAGLPLFDPKAVGGTTTVVLGIDGVTVEQEFISLAGTDRNCCGGPTPWGSWLSCEEPKRSRDVKIADGHGWVFEVPATARAAVEPVPLKAMGRFNHEAAAVDPATGVVYLSEDREDGLFYRFVPTVPGRLAAGGRLQACVVDGLTTTANRNGDWAAGTGKPVRWIDLSDVESPADDLRLRGADAGAATFVRGEGLAMAADHSVFLSCTSGGANQQGQIFRYQPTGKDQGKLTLFIEPGDGNIIDFPDNLTIAPWGGLVVCEDGSADNFLRFVTPDGAVQTLARNAHPDRSEFAGACFSPNGKILYVNIQDPGHTYAIQGPWATFGAATT